MGVAKQADTLPVTRAQCLKPDGSPQDLTGGTVRFHAAERRGLKFIDKAAEVEPGTAGWANFAWTADDRDTPGTYRWEFKATLSDDGVISFPNGGYNTLRIYPQLLAPVP